MPKIRNSKKSFIMIGTLLIILSLLLAGCLKKEPTIIEDKQTLEYGDDLTDQTFTINHEEEEMEGNFTDLDPEVDTMELGETEHLIELDGEQFLVTVVVEDTEMPVFSGVEDRLTLTGETVDIAEELKKRITAEDPVDGELEVTFEINDGENEHTYDVEAKATDKNENETVETFEVVVEIKVVKEEIEEEKIAFKTVNKDDASLNKGTTKVSTEGENGTKEVTYEVTYINDEEKSREKMKEEIIKEPKDKIVLNGTKPEANTVAQSKPNTESKANSNTSNNSNSSSNSSKSNNSNSGSNSNKSNNSNSGSNSSSSNQQDKPKEESKSEPNVQGPPGSTLTGNPADGVYEFSYNDNSLPGGGKITQVVVIGSGAGVIGVDRDGVQFNYSYSDNSFAFGKPDLSNEAISKVQSVASKFANSVK